VIEGYAARAAAAAAEGCDAWHPGVGTGVPAAFRGLETILRPECTESTLADIDELARFTGLPPERLTAFRPERLALHEVIVRVTADLAVAEGAQEEDFGRNFRRIALALHDDCVVPELPALVTQWRQLREAIAERTAATLAATLFAPAAPPARRRIPWSPFGTAPPVARAPAPGSPAFEERVLADYRRAAQSASDPLERAIYRALHQVLGAIAVHRGRIAADAALLTRLVATEVANGYGSRQLGEWLSPLIERGIAAHGFTRVPDRAAPVLISLKGASAAGKSSLRPMIKQLMRAEGIEPDGYATISPDVWRRLLLDYDTLGAAYKYAGHLTSREVMVIDGKLDRYIRAKAERAQAIPHLLVDRFRFDSFESERIARVLHDTYARFVDTLVMYFVVTPPEETVVRGWQRALERGRYKAVEDFLGHSVEAASGMPRILFKWLAHPRPAYRYFFLDNRVPRGTFPETIAFGTQAEMTVCRPLAFVDLARWQRIDVHAQSPDALYPPDADLSVAANCGFLAECLRRIPRVAFTTAPEAPPYAVFENARLTVADAAAFAAVRRDPDNDRLFETIAAR
jgi:hypothetical protein